MPSAPDATSRRRPSTEHVVVWFGSEEIADSHRAIRVLETSHAPVYGSRSTAKACHP